VPRVKSVSVILKMAERKSMCALVYNINVQLYNFKTLLVSAKDREFEQLRISGRRGIYSALVYYRS